MPPVPNQDRRSAAADAAERRAAAAAAAPREREDAAVAGQAAAVERLVAMGFTAERARCGLAQGFSLVEEAVGFLVAEGAADDGRPKLRLAKAGRTGVAAATRPLTAPLTATGGARNCR